MEFVDNASLTVNSYTSGRALLQVIQSSTLQTSLELKISGSGNLRLESTDFPTGKASLKLYSAVVVGPEYDNPHSSQAQPKIFIGSEILPANINLETYTARGIVSEAGLFSYYCPENTITIKGGYQEDGVFTGAGLVNGIIAGAVKNSSSVSPIASEISITANALSIYLAGESQTGVNNEMIASTVISNDTTVPNFQGQGGSDISIQAHIVNLIVDKSFAPKPGATDPSTSQSCIGIGIYSQSGRKFSSTIDISGIDSSTDTFVLKTYEDMNNLGSGTANVNGFQGIYMYDVGAQNSINIHDFKSVVVDLDSNLTAITGTRQLAPDKDMTTLTIQATEQIFLSNKSASTVNNQAEVFTIEAPSVTIYSGGGYAIQTKGFISNVGSTSINAAGGTISIASTGDVESGYAIITRGIASLTDDISSTVISGANIEISSQNAAAIYSFDKGETTVNGDDVRVVQPMALPS